MPRIARSIAPGYRHHIIQRGNNRATVFFDDEDRQIYLKPLAGYAEKNHLQFQSDHLHEILVAPGN